MTINAPKIDTDSKNSTPFISVCIPTYNGASFLNEALRSLEEQTFKDFEVVVSDDQSKDDTVSLIQKFTSETSLEVRLLSHNPNGIGANWNNSIRNAKGTWIKLLFQDDVLFPDCLNEMADYVSKAPDEVGILFCRKKLIGEVNEGMQTNADFLFNKYKSKKSLDILKDSEVLKHPRNKLGEPPCTLIRKDIFDKTGLFNEDLEQSLDYEFWRRALTKTEIAFIDKTLVGFRIHQHQTSKHNAKKVTKDSYLFPYLLLKQQSQYLSLGNKLLALYKLLTGSIRYRFR